MGALTLCEGARLSPEVIEEPVALLESCKLIPDDARKGPPQ